MANSTIQNLENFIDLASIRQKVINRNIANVNTEYYKREEVVFDDLFEEGINSAMKQTSGKHMGMSEQHNLSDMNLRVQQDDTNYNSGINNVNIDKEMSDLAENTILFRFAAKKISSYYRTYQEVIKGNRG